MNGPSRKTQRHFHAHETPRAHALNGLPLATFPQRLFGFCIDLLLAMLIWFPAEVAWRYFVLRETKVELHWDFHEIGNIVTMLLYWGLLNYFRNGQTPGKWIARTRILSLTSERMRPWQSLERALGYGSAMLEAGFGFLQFFWDANRMCAQDRLAETIVVDVRKRSRVATE